MIQSSANVSQHDAQPEAGFTLIEVLLGLALMALMTAVLAAALGGVRQAQRSHDRRTIATSVEPAEAYLRRLIADMRPLRQSNAAGAPLIEAPLIGAHGDRIEFVSGYSPPGGYAGLHRVTLQRVEAATAGVFDLEEVRALHRPFRRGDAEVRTRLVTGISGFQLSYLGARRPAPEGPRRAGVEAVWHTTWASPLQLPRMVNVEIVFPPGDPRRTSTLSIAIPAGQ